MKVLHLNANWNIGGAAIACKRLHYKLLEYDIDSQVLCQITEVPDERICVLKSRLPFFFQRVLKRLCFELKSWQFDETSYFLSLNFFRNNLIKEIKSKKPDIVHLHWVGADFLRIEDLPKIHVPLVWTLHDMWPFCGAEHCSFSEGRWKHGYVMENRPFKARGLDLNRWVWSRKQKSWHGRTIHTIGVSSWMDKCVRESSLFQGIGGMRRVIHNGLDENIFRPIQNSKQIHGSADGCFRIAFGAVKQSDTIKGGDLLLTALSQLKDEGVNLELVTFGGGEIGSVAGARIKNYGQIIDQLELASIYNTADVIVVPSRMESFGQTAAEAMACGKPVVCFDTSGLKDVVVHKKTGYRARCYDPADLAYGIRWCIEDPLRLMKLGQQARISATTRFSITDVAQQTIRFYKEILTSG